SADPLRSGPSDSVAEIDAGDRDLPRITALVWEAIHAANEPPFLFRYGELARVEQGPDGRPFVRLLTPDRLRYVLARVARWYVGGHCGRRSAYPPRAVLGDMLPPPAPPLPVLKRMVEAPVFGPDGTLEMTPGYQRRSGHYYAPACGFPIPP